jgi:AraC family transcriptional regulator of adaptative response/methylated-DNA-[protein]-cysteine methyltransferase
MGRQFAMDSRIRVAAGAAAVILRSMNAAISVPVSRDFHRISRAIEFIADHFREQPSLARIAAAAGVSEYHFARSFRRWAGISPKQLVQRLSVESAKQALDVDASVLQAALDAGLSGPGRLHDLFVSLEAVTPGEFKSRGRGIAIRHGSADTPFGPARIAVTDRGVAFLGFADDAGRVPGWKEFCSAWPAAQWREDDESARAIADLIWGVAPAQGRRLRLWVHGTNFQVQVWRALLERAAHATLSYADIAGGIGRPQAARAVGAAVGSNPVAWLIPCHHVLRANRALGGYRWGLDRKRAMLAWELARTVRTSSRPLRGSSRASP